MKSARMYVRGLMQTHREEKADWTEPQWSAHQGILIALLNLIDEVQGDPDAFWRLMEAAQCQSSSNTPPTSSS